MITLFQIVTFNNKSNEMSLRVSSMDYLALIASHLRRDAVDSRDKDKEDLKDIIQQVFTSFKLSTAATALTQFSMYKLLNYYYRSNSK